MRFCFLLLFITGFFSIPVLSQTVNPGVPGRTTVTLRADDLYAKDDNENAGNNEYRWKIGLTTPAVCIQDYGSPGWYNGKNVSITSNTTANSQDALAIAIDAWEDDCGGSCDYNGCCSTLGVCVEDDNGRCQDTQYITPANFAPGTTHSMSTMFYCVNKYAVNYSFSYRTPVPASPSILVNGSSYVSPNVICGNADFVLSTNTYVNNPSSVTLTWYYNISGETTLETKANPAYCGPGGLCDGTGGPVESFEAMAQKSFAPMVAAALPPGEPGDPPPCCFEPPTITSTVARWRTIGSTTGGGSISFKLRDLPGIDAKTTNSAVRFYVVASANGSTSAPSPLTAFVSFAPAPPYINGDVTSSIVEGKSCLNQQTGSITINNITGATNDYRYYVTKDGETRGPAQSFNNASVPITISNLQKGTYKVELANNGGDLSSCATTYTNIEILTHTNPDISGAVSQNVTCSGGSDGIITVSSTGGNPNATVDFTISPVAGNFVRANATSGSFQNLPAGTYTVTGVDKVNSSNCGNPDSQNNLTIAEPTRVTGNYSGVIHPDCTNAYNGQVTVTASQGSGTYNYRIFKDSQEVDSELGTTLGTVTFSGLASGSYVVTVKDAARDNCPGYESPPFPINNVTELAISLTSPQKNSTCADAKNGEIYLTVSGGSRTQDYAYTLTNTTTGIVYTNASANFSKPAADKAKFISLGPGNYRAQVKNNNSCVNSKEITSIPITEPGRITPVISKDEITCRGDADGNLTVTSVSGGIGPFTYAWEYETLNASNQIVWELYSSGQNNTGPLDPGTYRVKVTEVSNSGCFVYSDTYSFVDPSVVSVAEPTISQVTCKGLNDAQITMSASGGWGTPFNYEYSTNGVNYTSFTSASKFAPATYYLRATDRLGCVVDYEDEVVITESALPLTASIDKFVTNDDFNVYCKDGLDGKITITPTGGNGSPFTSGTYSFSIDGGAFQSQNIFSSLPAGNHTVRVRDERMCIIAQEVLLKEPERLTIELEDKNYIKCFSDPTGFIEVSAGGGLPGGYKYQLNSGAFEDNFRFENLSGGDYTITVRDRNGCTASLTESILSPNSKLVIEFEKQDVSCFGLGDGKITATISGGSGQKSLLWKDRTETANVIQGLAPGEYELTVTDAEGCSASETETILQPLAPLSAELKTNHIVCFGEVNGKIEVKNVEGGTSPYEFSLDALSFQTFPDFSGRSKGNYSVTVRDKNKCTIVLNTSVIEPPVLIPAIAGKVDVLCHGDATGEITGSASGGVGPYKFSLDGINFESEPKFTGLHSGAFVLHTKDDFGCVKTIDELLIQPQAPLSLSSVITPVQCKEDANGKIETMVAGGTSPYQYAWENLAETTASIVGLAAREYEVLVTDDHGCTLQRTFEVPEPAIALSGVVISQINVSCSGLTDGSFAVEAVGGYAPYDYSFNGNVYNTQSEFTALGAGAQSVVVRDTMGCVVYVPAFITEPDPLIASAEEIKNISCFGLADGSFKTAVAGGKAPYEFSIDLGNRYQADSFFSGLTKNIYEVQVRDSHGCMNTTSVTISQPDPLTAAVEGVINSSCQQKDGFGRIEAVGGTLPYTYSWISRNLEYATGQETALEAGLYKVSVTDRLGCKAFAEQIIVDQDGPQLAISAISDATCFYSNDGSATVEATGGAGNYQYAWSDNLQQTTPAAVNLIRGLYTVEVTDGRGCKSLSQATVNSPQEIVLNVIEKTSPLCFESTDGKIVVAATGGVAPHTYTWLNSSQDNTGTALRLGRGVYQVRTNDNVGCEGTFTIDLNAPEALSVTVGNVKFTTCAGGNDGEASVNSSGGTAPYSYLWNDPRAQTTSSANMLAEGSYSVITTDKHGCTVTTPIVLDKIQPIKIALGGSTLLCADQTVVLDAGVENATYVWKKDNVSFSGTKSVVLRDAGVYTVDVTDTKGCKGSDSFTVKTSTRSFEANFLGASELITGDSLMLVEVCFPRPDSIHWSYQPVHTLLVDSEEQPQITYQKPGDYKIVMTAHFAECTDTMEKTVAFLGPEQRGRINGRLALGESGFKSVKAYPNPTSGKIEIEVEMHRVMPVALMLYNFAGKEIHRVIDRNKLLYRFSFDLSEQINGVYLASVVTDGHKKDLRILLMK
jgi:hypothetical protein